MTKETIYHAITFVLAAVATYFTAERYGLFLGVAWLAFTISWSVFVTRYFKDGCWVALLGCSSLFTLLMEYFLHA